MSYISRQAAIEAIENVEWYHINQNGELVSGANSQEHEPLYKAADVYAAIEEVPSAQPEIIRCKECIEWDSDSEWCNRHGGTMQENDFCSRAERRDNGND